MHFDMAMSRPDGVPLNGECFDYTWSDAPTFTDENGRVHCARRIDCIPPCQPESHI